MTPEDRVPENEHLRAVKARLAAEEARLERRRGTTRRYAASLNAAGVASGAVLLGLGAGVVALFAFRFSSPLIWAVAAVLGVACAVDAWVLYRAGSRGPRS